MSSTVLEWAKGRLQLGGVGLFSVDAGEDGEIAVEPPEFEINGEQYGGFTYLSCESAVALDDGVVQHAIQYECPKLEGVKLTVKMRIAGGSPVVRYRYILSSTTPVYLTKRRGNDHLIYQRVRFNTISEVKIKEIQVSNFQPIVHSYIPTIQELRDYELLEGVVYAGPISLLGGRGWTALLAYEHGHEHPNRFIEFAAKRDLRGLSVSLSAAKGNYFHGRLVGDGQIYESVWFEFGLVRGGQQDLLREYRNFVLHYMAENNESRKPYIFYNSWNYQERVKYFGGHPYLSEMNENRMKQEIEIAYRTGVDVFVIDTGWYEKTGDWSVSKTRFPRGLRKIKGQLDSYGMKLGLWFNPTVAAKSSRIYRSHPEYVMSWEGKERYHDNIWETEGSYGMCMASPYSNWFIEKLVHLHNELGVVYFKWDGISQYGCDSPNHWHGNQENPPQERAENYAFEMVKQMTRVASELGRRCPGTIVDFDVTEAGRCVGLGFLAAGKYFLMNNGPYFHSFDIPRETEIRPDTINVFFYPGPARARVCRQGVLYDPILPAQLFLTHFLPDPPLQSQNNSIASMFLGGNGIWGDLVSLNTEDIDVFAKQISLYKKVAAAVATSYPITKGFIGSSPEIYEKLDPETGQGIVVFFTCYKGVYTHLTQPLHHIDKVYVENADTWERVGDSIKLTISLDKHDARVVFVRQE